MDDWSITQSGGLVSQLDCGARAFDYRPFCEGGEIFAHHGAVKIDRLLRDSIEDIRGWLAANTDQMVLLYLSHFDGDANCEQTTQELVQSMGIFPIACADVSSITVSQAFGKGAQLVGGSIVAVIDCMEERYDDTVNCYTSVLETCYGGPSGGEIAWARMLDYQRVSTAAPANDSLWMTQLHWQSTAASIAYGTLHGGSIIKDEERGGVNAWVADMVRSKQFAALSLVELDSVCHGGLDVYNAILEMMPASGTI